MKRLHLKISGRVQGVGYRYFAENAAAKMNVVGWVRNMPDGRVEVEVQGDMKSLEDFMLELRKGPVLSRVKEIAQFELTIFPDERSFGIRY